MEKIEKLGNFWLIWLSCAGERKSLYQIQKDWGIRTNYLYHPEKSLKIPMFKAMLNEGYLRKEGKYLIGEFEWVKKFLVVNYEGSLIEKHLEEFMKFLTEKRDILFKFEHIRILFRGNPVLAKRYGRNIFSWIFLYILYRDFREISKVYKAEYIARIFRVLIEFVGDVNLKTYFDRIDESISGYSPVIIKTLKEWITLSKI